MLNVQCCRLWIRIQLKQKYKVKESSGTKWKYKRLWHITHWERERHTLMFTRKSFISIHIAWNRIYLQRIQRMNAFEASFFQTFPNMNKEWDGKKAHIQTISFRFSSCFNKLSVFQKKKKKKVEKIEKMRNSTRIERSTSRWNRLGHLINNNSPASTKKNFLSLKILFFSVIIWERNERVCLSVHACLQFMYERWNAPAMKQQFKKRKKEKTKINWKTISTVWKFIVDSVHRAMHIIRCIQSPYRFVWCISFSLVIGFVWLNYARKWDQQKNTKIIASKIFAFCFLFFVAFLFQYVAIIRPAQQGNWTKFHL